MTEIPRGGALGALMDEYERAVTELLAVLAPLSAAEFTAVRDATTSDPDCRSVQAVVRHLIASGYGYAGMLREAWGLEHAASRQLKPAHDEAEPRLRAMLAYTVATCEGRWDLTPARLEAVRITARWGQVFDLDQLLEHAVMHVHRHRRQIERWLAR